MIIYLDTSSLLKFDHQQEVDSEAVNNIISNSEEIYIYSRNYSIRILFCYMEKSQNQGIE